MSPNGYFVIRPDQRRVGVSTGGGGYGPAWERDVERVRCDVRDGYITRSTARERFGVVVDEAFDPSVDLEATERERARLAAESTVSPILPTGPGAATWLEEQMAPADTIDLNPQGT